MRMRSLVAGVLSVVPLLAVSAGPAGAQVVPSGATWDEAAAFARFPVWRPARTLGLRGRVGTRTCDFGDVPQMASASYHNRGSRRRVTLIEHMRGFPCGNPEVWNAYRTVRIAGRPVLVRRAPGGGGLAADLVMPARAWHAGGLRRTAIHAVALRVGLAPFVRMLRSLRVVDVRRPTVRLERFLSSDGSVWCGLRSGGERWCSSRDPQHGASLHPDGRLRLCGVAQADPAAQLCIQNWNVDEFRLADGQRSDANGFTCSDEAGAITCTVKAGTAAGTGFRVSAAGSAAVIPG